MRIINRSNRRIFVILAALALILSTISLPALAEDSEPLPVRVGQQSEASNSSGRAISVRFLRDYETPEYITRARLAELLCAFIPFPEVTENGFSDLTGEDDRAEPLLRMAASGLLYIPEDGTIQPDGYVSREYLISILYNLFDLDPVYFPPSGVLDFNSVAYKDAVATFFNCGYIPASMLENGSFSPCRAIRCDEVISILTRLISFFVGFESYDGGIINGNVYAVSDDSVPDSLLATGTIFIGAASPAAKDAADKVYIANKWSAIDPETADYSVVIGEFTSAIFAGTSGNNTNVSLAATAINGTILEPGEEFSFNSVVGPRTAARGYQYGPVYVGDEVVQGLGGGICQPASNLFNAALQAGMTILERGQHTMKVDYAKPGLDAAITYGYLDLRFVNGLDVPVKIVMETNIYGGYTSAVIYAPKGYIKPDIAVNVSQSGNTYTTTRAINGVVDFKAYTSY